MPFPLTRPQPEAPAYCVIGKLPQRSDFIRIHATHPDAQLLDHLAGKSLARIADQPDAQERYHRAPTSYFLLRSQTAPALFIGSLRPSHDEAGRLYPLIAGALTHAPEPLALGECLLARELFLTGLSRALDEAYNTSVELFACRTYLERHAESSGTSITDADPDLHLARQLLDRSLERTPASDFDALVQTRSSGRLAAILLSFVFYYRLVTKYGSSLPPQACLLPLPEPEGEATLSAAMWLSLYQAATAGHGAPREQALIVGRGGQRSLALCPGAMADAHLGLCWDVPPQPQSLIDVNDENAPWRKHQAWAEAAYVLGQRLMDPSLTLAELRDVVRDLSLNIS